MEFRHYRLELSGHNEEVAALYSDHYTQVRMDIMYNIIA